MLGKGMCSGALREALMLVHLQRDHLHLLVSHPLLLSSCLPAILTSGLQDCFHLGVAAVSEAVCFLQQRTKRHEQTWTPCWQMHAGASCKHCIFCCLLRAASLEEPAVKPRMLLNTTEDLFAPSPILFPTEHKLWEVQELLWCQQEQNYLQLVNATCSCQTSAKTVSSPECSGVGNPKAVQSRDL